jgi:hypothetical protein
VTGTVLAIAIGLVIPLLATTSAPAAADTVIDGCTIVEFPTPTDFTNCPGADLAGADLAGVDLNFANLTGADLAGATFITSFFNPDGVPSTTFDPALISTADLSQANLSGSVFVRCAPEAPPEPPIACGSVGFPDSNLSNANLSNDLLAIDVVGEGIENTDFTGATLTGANLTGTSLIPSNQSVTATSQTGAVATWSTPAASPGATPGSCTPASGSTFPLFSSTVTCQVLDGNGDVAHGTFQVNVTPTTQYFTRVLLPSDGTVVQGLQVLDAAAGDAPGVTNVVFEVSGGTIADQVVATATPTIYGWLAEWNTTSVPNGTYTLQSVATDAAANTDTSGPVTITVNNQPPSTAVLIPSGGATVSGASQLLDASASSAAGIASVTYELSGGPSNIGDKVIATATPTLYGWLAQWNTTTVPNGTYTLHSVATDPVAETAASAPITITVDNPPPTTTVLVPSAGATVSGTSAVLDASASSNVTSISFELTGGPDNGTQIATATPTIYGWIGFWNTTSVPDGTYTLQSVASYAGGVSGTSAPITITVAPTVSFAASSEYPFSSGQAVGLVLNQPATDTVQVDFTSADGPEVTIQCCEWIGAASWFSPSSGTVTFAPGQTSATVTLTVSPATVTGCSIPVPACYPSETMTLVNPTNAVLGAPSATNVFYQTP